MGERYRFDPFEFDVASGVLRRDAEEIALRPKLTALLALLLRRAGQVVPKQEILAAVWPRVHVSDATLADALRDLRGVLGDTGSAPRFVRTLRGRGMRFVAPVTTAPAVVAAPSPLERRPSLVVLPLAAFSHDPNDELLADAFCEDLTTQLSRSRGFFVIARTSAFQYKTTPADLRVIGRELGVSYAVEGSVRRRGPALRVAIQLVETERARHLWAERWDCDLAEVFGLVDDLVETISAQVLPALVSGEAARAQRTPPANLDAWLLYQRALDTLLLRGQSREDIREAKRYIDAALELEPNFARARALRGTLLGYVALGDAAAGAEARADCERAFALAPDDPPVLRAWASFLGRSEGPAAAIALLERALQLDPNDVGVLALLGVQLAKARRPSEAISCIERAMQRSPRDPRLWSWHQFLANTYLQLGDWAAARASAERSLAQNDYQAGHLVRAAALARAGLQQEATEALTRARRKYPRLSLARAAANWRDTMLRDAALEREFLALLARAGLE